MERLIPVQPPSRNRASSLIAGMASALLSMILISCVATESGPRSLPTDTTYFIPRPTSAAPSREFNGRLTLQADPANSHIETLVDIYGVAADAFWNVSTLPSIEIDFVQDGSDVIPVQRGAQAGQHPYWEWIFEPGKAWDEAAAPGWTRVSLPFSLQERNQNCTHHGLMRFSFNSEGSITPVEYQLGSETCLYFKANLWGRMAAKFQPVNSSHRDRVVDEHRAHVSSQLPIKPISGIAADHPGISADSFLPPGQEDVTVFGLVLDGVHYRGGCETRFGPHPYCEWLDLPSYSLAKSVFAGLTFIYLAKNFPEFSETEVSGLVPECRLEDGRWDGVTLWHLLNMTTGNYDDAGFEVDESAENMGDFFLPDAHAEKILFSCTAYNRKADPGEVFVYHTSDTYLLGTAMNAFIRQKGSTPADIFDDILVDKLFSTLKLSPAAKTSRRTYDEVAQPFTGFGLTWTADDIARIGQWLNRDLEDDSSLLYSSYFLDAMFRDTGHIRRQAGAHGEAYSNGFWGFEIAHWISCGQETWIPFMSGYGGNVVALLPNGSVYYYFSDGNRFKWVAAAAESNKILNYCEDK